MTQIERLVLAAAVMSLTAAAAIADPMVGAVMSANKNIVENASNSKVLTTFVAAAKAGGLIGRLEGTEPYTVFAPTNAAFHALPAGAMQKLLQPPNKSKLDRILTYNMVPGRLDIEILDQYIRDGGGNAYLTTVEGGMLMISGSGENLTITDAKGDTAKIIIPDVYQSNGVIMVTDLVLMPS